MTINIGITLLFVLFIVTSQSALCQQPSAVETEAFNLYQQHQYAAAADKFEGIIRARPNARCCYYAALACRASNRQLRARQLFQYLIATFPGSPEASSAKTALTQSSQLSATTSSSVDAQDLPDSVKSLLPADMKKMLDTSIGRQAVQQVLKDQGDQVEAIRKAEKAGTLPHDKLAAAVESAGIMTAHPDVNRQYPFTAADIAKAGARAIDQARYPNCWFEASLAALAELPRGQRLIASMIRYRDTDKYVVRFPYDGKEYVITAADLANSGVHDSALWASLIQCAEIMKFPDNAGANGAEGDQSRLEIGLGCITGCKAEIKHPGECTTDELSSFIGGAVTSRNPIVASTLSDFPRNVPQLAIPLHAYTIIGFEPSQSMILIRNPHGRNAARFELPMDSHHLEFEQLDDGVFRMSIATFQKYFYSVARSFI